MPSLSNIDSMEQKLKDYVGLDIFLLRETFDCKSVDEEPV